jgi:tRNA modification GTPase
VLDRAVITLFATPASYTGEDLVEISCHGGLIGPDLILGACVRSGARNAEPGEFTRRAYLNGKLDLVEAEGIADLIEARSAALRRVAVGQLEGGLSTRIAEARSAVIGLEARLLHHLDFPMEDDAPVPLEEIAREAGDLSDRLERLAATAPGGMLLREGALTVFAGRPNAGKSSLFNALLGEDRAIVTQEPGTTRDAVEAGTSLDGYPFRLVDTAGLREAEGEVERLGIEVARRYLRGADVVVYCLEAGRSAEEDDLHFLREVPRVPVVVARTRADEVTTPVPSGFGSDVSHGAEIPVSVSSGSGLDRLKVALQEAAFSGVVGALAREIPVITRERQVSKVRAAAGEIRAFAEALLRGVPGEVASAHLKSAETLLEEMLGIVEREEVLDRVFADFCIGK